MKLEVFCLLPLIAVTLGDHVSPIVVDTPLGKIEGGLDESVSGRPFYSFMGIPYAMPPVGELRFEEPVPVKPWSDVWVAKTMTRCMQFTHYTDTGDQEFLVTGDEDCLHAHVYTPTLDKKANLDVVVYIHGGAFQFSHGGELGPHILMDREVVTVRINYRLGPLGFLSTEDRVVPGNNGIKDQTMALRWIKDNIQHFGGNPDSITIIGMSAGGVSVHLHTLTPRSKGLFHKAISQSGCALNPWILMENGREKAMKMASMVGCSTENTNDMVKCLKRRPARQIVDNVRKFQPILYNPITPFGVVVDADWSSDPVLPDHPYRMLQNKQVTDVPWIVSFTNDEGLYPGADFYPNIQALKDIDQHWNELVPHILDYNFTVDVPRMEEVGQKIRKFYMQNKRVSQTTFMDFMHAMSDRLYVYGLGQAAMMQSAAVKSPVRSYHFTYRGTHSQSEYRTKSTKDFGASHGDDTSYIFKISLDMLHTKDDKMMSEILVGMVTSFAKTGMPHMPVEWSEVPKTMKGPLSYLRIESPHKIHMESNDDVGNFKFWHSLPIKENENLFGDGRNEL